MRRATPGNVIKIVLSDGSHTYARELRHPFVAVYDARDVSETDVAQIVKRPILFVVAVHDSAFSGWKKVAFQPLEEGEAEVPLRFMQNIADPNKCRIVDGNGVAREATPDECEGLERVAVWDPEHVDERLLAHFRGEPSQFVESLKLERP
jgi:hypothetical protein